jgi:hypothetical protein
MPFPHSGIKAMNKLPEEFGGRLLGNYPGVLQVFAEVKQGEEYFADCFKTIDQLHKDAQRTIAYLNKGVHSEFWKRAVIKTMFAAFEGQAFAMKRIALAKDKILEIGFRIEELAFLREDKCTLDKDGTANRSDKGYLEAFPNMKFAFKAFAKAHGKTFQLDAAGFRNFGTVKGIRDRLTHPKSAGDLIVSDTELKLAEKVFQWFLDESAKVFRLCHQPSSLPIRLGSARATTEISMSWLLYWPDGNAFEFPTKRAAKRFADANGATVERSDFMLFGPY